MEAGVFAYKVDRNTTVALDDRILEDTVDPTRIEETEADRDWINSLKDLGTRARIQVRVDRLVHGDPGSHRHLTDGIGELKIDVGPGYRVYYMIRETRLLLLLAGGDKSTQRRDIEKAIRLARNDEE